MTTHGGMAMGSVTERRHGEVEAMGKGRNAEHSLSDDKLRHIRAVAEVMRDTALANGLGDEEADRMYLLGLVHDVGYLHGARGHAGRGADLLASAGYELAEEVRLHGRLVDDPSDALLMLWHADLSCDWRGRRVGYDERLAGVIERYGEGSEQARNVRAIVGRLQAETRLVFA